MLSAILAAIKQFLLGLISFAALIAIIISVVTGQPVAHAPTAASASITTDEDTTSAPVTPSVTDPDAADTFTFSIASQPANGSAAVVNNQLVYVPAANFNGTDSFTFRATDSTNLSVVGTASVTVAPVNDPPTVADLALITNEDTPSAPATPSVTDPDIGDRHTFTIVTQPGRGLAAVVGDQIVYTPDADFNGQDTFTFRATDLGGLSAVATASVTVTPVADAPSATHAGITARAGTPGSPVTPFVEDADLFQGFIYQVLSAPANGVASVVGNKLVYVPNPGFVIGLDSFAYRATDSDGLTIDGTALVRVYSGTGFSRCTSPSTVNVTNDPNTNGTINLRTTAGPCGFYGEVVTRATSDGTPVIVKYIAHRPSNGAAPRAAVFLIGGGNLEMGLVGDAATGNLTASGGNFLVRTAQLFANAGYLAIAMDRPSDRPTAATPTEDTLNIDAYRVSVDHATDILAVLRQVNTDGLDVFLAGTSRGAISVVGQNPIAAGISISSAVTNGLVVGNLNVRLQPSFVQRPAHLLLNTNDLCSFTTPAAQQALFNNLTAAGVNAAIDSVSGGVAVTNGTVDQVDICGALGFHGYLGIEPTAVGRITAWLDGRVAALAGNRRPEAAFATVATAAGVPKQVNLTTLARDLDGDSLSYGLSQTTTSRGGTVSLDAGIATYTPPGGASNVTDYFVYVVTDGKGGVDAAVITVQIGG